MITTIEEHSARQPLVSIGIIVTPDEMDADAYLNIMWAYEKIRGESDDVIEIRITGYGGFTQHTLALYDLFKADGNIITVVMGMAYSAHSVLWCAGTKRYMYPNSILGVHQNRGGFGPELYTSNDAKLEFTRINHANDKMLDIYAENSNKDKDFWRELIDKTSSSVEIITPEMAVEWGMGELYSNKSDEVEDNIIDTIVERVKTEVLESISLDENTQIEGKSNKTKPVKNGNKE